MIKIKFPWTKDKKNQEDGVNAAHYLIFGLGNPGPEYKHNRHNVGFMFIDHLSEMLGIRMSRVQFKSLWGSGSYSGNKLTLIKPQTYMNLSGQAVASFVRYYKPEAEQICVAFDDMDLPFGTIRLRASGSSGGQKGIESTIEKLGTRDFPRLRIGVGRPPGRMQGKDYILQDFSRQEQKELPFVFEQASRALLTFIEDGINKAMTEYNGQVTDVE
jgi:peptidyl-tRNA hydrolase, PTH1 family